MTPYFAAIIGTAFIWIILFFLNQRLRHSMLLVSLLVCPLVIVDYLTTPVYWSPITMWNIPVGFEAFIFTFFLAGIAFAFPKIFRFKKAKDAIRINWREMGLVVEISFIGLLVALILNLHGMYLVLFSLLTVNLVHVIRRKRSVPELAKSAFVFGLFYFFSFSLWTFLAPQALSFWNKADFLGGTLIGAVPLGETIFGFLFGGTIDAIFN